MGTLRKIASISTVGIVPFYDDDERQRRDAHRVATAEVEVSAFELDSARAQVRRSQAEVALAQFEANRLRVDLDALHARYVELERTVKRTAAEAAQRRSNSNGSIAFG